MSAHSKSSSKSSAKSRSKKQTKTATAVAEATEVTLAPFWKRLFAWVYDLLGALGIFVLALVVGEVALYFVTLAWVDDFSAFSTKMSQSPLWAIYLFAVVQYYYVWCWVKGGQTVGMKAWRLQLYRSDGQLLSWKQAYIRSFLSLGGLANLWSLIDTEKRGWHDLPIDSRVVELPKDFYKNKDQKPLI